MELPDDLEGCVAHYPGRGSRYREPAIDDLTRLVENLHQAVQPLLEKPFAFFGHSLGGLAAYELTLRLRKSDLPQPVVLFISACAAPHLHESQPLLHTLPDDEFLKVLKDMNGTPSELLHDAELMKLFLPMLRADFEAIESYRYEPDEPVLDTPIFAFGGLADRRVSRQQLEGWADHTKKHFASHYFPGDHFFLNTFRESIMESVTAEIQRFTHG